MYRWTKYVALAILLLFMMHPNRVFAQTNREKVLEHALLHQYSNQILDNIQARKYCAQVLDIKETSADSGVSGWTFETVIGVVSQDIQGSWEYLRMTVVDDVMGVRVSRESRQSNLTEKEAKQLCTGESLSEHYPLRDHFPPRYLDQTVKGAEELPLRYINLINEKRYDEAVSLLSPQLREFYSSSAGRRALENIKHMRVIKLIDITPIKPVVRYLPRHYAIKTYGAIIDKEVYDPKPFARCPGAIGIQVNKFEVIKYTPESPWLIDGQSGVPPATAKRWGLDIGKNDFDFCRRYSEGSKGLRKSDGGGVN